MARLMVHLLCHLFSSELKRLSAVCLLSPRVEMCASFSSEIRTYLFWGAAMGGGLLNNTGVSVKVV